ncbi:hypothetical protein ACHAWO_010620 [Cyclotella atomus]|uniref:Uncharacterized protein n=1 Tax=Cyclotella atomus TaxID=382360 RepID=A0ABD3MX45_9STRA
MRCDEMSSFRVVRFCRFRKTSQVQILMNPAYLVEEGDFDKKTRSALKETDPTGVTKYSETGCICFRNNMGKTGVGKMKDYQEEDQLPEAITRDAMMEKIDYFSRAESDIGKSLYDFCASPGHFAIKFITGFNV